MKKTRNTRQRGAILEILRAESSHLTAEEVYLKARKVLPSISLGTVYRNLNHLREQGMAREIRNGDSGSGRFEAARDQHAHFHCRRCHAVRDLPLPDGLRETLGLNPAVVAAVSHFDLHVTGDCADCSPAT